MGGEIPFFPDFVRRGNAVSIFYAPIRTNCVPRLFICFSRSETLDIQRDDTETIISVLFQWDLFYSVVVFPFFLLRLLI